MSSVDSSTVKQLIGINLIQNKSFCLHNICVCTVYNTYLWCIYKYKHMMYIFKKNMLCLYIKFKFKFKFILSV